MNPPWTAERSLSPGLVRQLIEQQFPELAPVRVAVLGEGWDNQVFRVNEDFVFRFPRRSAALDGLATESRVLPHLARTLPLPIPVPNFLGSPSEAYAWPFHGYRMLPGATACRARLSDEQRVELAEPLARFLKALHSTSVELIGSWHIPSDQLGRMDLARRVPQLAERLDDLKRKRILPDPAPFLKIIEQTTAQSSSSELGLVHGDLYFRHLLIDAKGQLSGIIDWGDVHYGHPAIDLSIAFGFLPPRGRELFFRGYGRILEDAGSWARFRALYMAVTLLAYGHDTGDEAAFHEAGHSLELLRAD